MERKLRIGIIGTGGIAHSHMRSYLQMDDVEIVGASDIVPGKARAFLDEFELNDVPAFENNAELLKLDLDGVSVCTYNTTHHICACEAMEAGVNVLCEKPMSVTLGQAVEMARTQKKTGKILTIGFQPRYGANMRMVKELVRSGELGRVYYVQTGGGRRRGIPGGTFVDKKLAGVGCLADIGCYALDMALNTVGYKRPVTVSAYSSDFFGKNPKSVSYTHLDVYKRQGQRIPRRARCNPAGSTSRPQWPSGLPARGGESPRTFLVHPARSIHSTRRQNR